MESPFEELDGVTEVLAGYTGGHKEDPTYEEVTTGKTGHLEAVQITFDPSIITYSELLDVFWRQINPTDIRGQFADRGELNIRLLSFITAKNKNGWQKSPKKNYKDQASFKWILLQK